MLIGEHGMNIEKAGSVRCRKAARLGCFVFFRPFERGLEGFSDGGVTL